MNLDALAGEDQDVLWFLRVFEEKPPCNVLEIGAQEEFLGYILSRKGYNVAGVDLRGQLLTYEAFDKAFDVQNKGFYMHCQHDFLEVDINQPLDVVVSLSTLEHFGLGTYGERFFDAAYDAKAVTKIWNNLKPGGSFYVTVPVAKYGIVGRLDGVEGPNGEYLKMYKEHADDIYEWRIYNRESLKTRIIQAFTVKSVQYFFDAPYHEFKRGDIVSEEVAFSDRNLPCCSVALHLKKPV